MDEPKQYDANGSEQHVGHVARNVCGNMLCCKTDGLKNCSRCKSVAYCSIGCQKIDWKTRHKRTCTPPSVDLTPEDVKEDMAVLREVMKRISLDQLIQLSSPDYCIVVQSEGNGYCGTVIKFDDAKVMIGAQCSIDQDRLKEMSIQCSSRQGNFIYVILVHNRSNVRSYTLKINNNASA